jgi:hypothetical protein
MGLGLGAWGHGHYSNPDRGLQNLNFFGATLRPVLGEGVGEQLATP